MSHGLRFMFVISLFIAVVPEINAVHRHGAHLGIQARARVGGVHGSFIGQLNRPEGWLAFIALGIFTTPIWFRLLRWGTFQFKSFDTLHREAHALLLKYEKRYGPSSVIVETMQNETAANQDAAFKKSILQCYEYHNRIEGGTWTEFFRKLDWLSDYTNIVRYPFLHYENRLRNAISWLQQYRSKLENSQLAPHLDQEMILLQRLLTHVLSSYEYHQEKNQKHQDEQLAAIQAQQAQQQQQQQHQQEEILDRLDELQQPQYATPSAPPNEDGYPSAPPAYEDVPINDSWNKD